MVDNKSKTTLVAQLNFTTPEFKSVHLWNTWALLVFYKLYCIFSVGQALVYHLSEVRGMSEWYDKYGVLGLTPETVQQALTVAGSFMLKASELQQ